MLKSDVKVYKRRMGKNHYLIIKIYQKATASTETGNALASNALHINITKKNRR